MTNLPQAIREIKNQIIAKYQPEKIILFGSHAWGEPDSNSDVDLCVIKTGIDHKKPHQRSLEVSKLFEHKVATDVLAYSPYEVKKELWLGNPFVKKIVNQGKVLYDTSTTD